MPINNFLCYSYPAEQTHWLKSLFILHKVKLSELQLQVAAENCSPEAITFLDNQISFFSQKISANQHAACFNQIITYLIQLTNESAEFPNHKLLIKQLNPAASAAPPKEIAERFHNLLCTFFFRIPAAFFTSTSHS